jgi:uncharacterized protein (TIGR03067 family)
MKTLLFALIVPLLVVRNLCAIPDRPPRKKADPVEEEKRKLEGTWGFAGMELNGRLFVGALTAELKVKFGRPEMTIKGGKLTGIFREEKTTIPLKIRIARDRKEIDITRQVWNGQSPVLALYTLEGDTLKTCLSRAGNKRPAAFGSNGGNYILIWKRIRR